MSDIFRRDLGRKYGLTLKKDIEDVRDYKYTGRVKKFNKDLTLNLPMSVDHTEKMSPVKDQRNLGSCVGFATCALKEWQEQKEHNEEIEQGKKNHRDKKYYDLSEAWVYWMCKTIDEWPNSEGTSIRCAMKVLNKIGVPVEKAWPYDDKVYGEPKIWANLVALWSLIGSYYRLDGLTEIKTALAKAPVVAGIGCFEEIFHVGDDGYVPYPKSTYSYGGHAICLVGFNDSTGLIKFKNSWGSGWGDEGYGYFSYEYAKDFLWDAWVAVDISVTKDMLKGARSLLA
jgi:C1A family cysteine protease